MKRHVNLRKQAAFPFLPHLDVSGLADRLLVEARRLADVDGLTEPRIRAALLLAAARLAHAVDQQSTGFVRDACSAFDLGRAIGFAELAHRDTFERDAAAARVHAAAVAETAGDPPTLPSPPEPADPAGDYQGSAGAADLAADMATEPP